MRVRSSSLRAQEVWRSICSCPLPEVLPINAQSLVAVYCWFIVLSTPFLVSFKHSITQSEYTFTVNPRPSILSKNTTITCLTILVTDGTIDGIYTQHTTHTHTLSIILLIEQRKDLNIPLPKMSHMILQTLFAIFHT